MSGPDLLGRPRRTRRGAALTLVFSGVLAAGAATGCWTDALGHAHKEPGDRTKAAAHEQDVADAAAEALADGKSPMDAARKAVSRSGDRWGAVYSEGEYAEFAQSLDGEYTGVGIWARRAEGGRVEVARVQDGGPAALAGIRKGDRLRTIDGRRVDGLPVTEVVGLLRGDADPGGTDPGDAHSDDAHPGGSGRSDPEVGTAVSLGVQRGTHAWHESLRRARLSTNSVTVEPLHDTAREAVLIKVGAFTKGSGERVRDAVRAAPRNAGILLDLRGNSGGLVTEATATASAFLDGGLVATYDVGGSQRALHARSGGDTHRPLVALVDGGTMSAAELLTGALQDRGRAVVVGSRTFGKGSVQMPSRLADGSVAELTVGHYRTPSGRRLDGRGISPDLETADAARAQAETVLSGLGSPS